MPNQSQAAILYPSRFSEVRMRTFTAYVELDEETKLYVGVVPGVPGAHSQGATLDELQKNMKEVLELCIEEQEQEPFSHFVGLQQIEIAV